MKNVKQEHGILDKKCLKGLSKLKSVTKIIPGEISWRKKTTQQKPGLYFQRTTETGLKLAIKSNMYVQDVFVVIDIKTVDIEALRLCVQNGQKIVL